MYAREISKNPLPCLRRQHVSGDEVALSGTTAFEQEEEECLVLDDRTTETSSVLITVPVIHRPAVQVIAPGVGIQCGIVVRPEQRSSDLVGSRPRDQLHLPGAAAHFGICRRDDDAHFLNKVGGHVRDGARAGVIASIRNDDAVQRDIRRACPVSGKYTAIAASGFRTGGRPDQIHHIAGHKRESSYLVLRKYGAQRRRGRRQNGIRRYGHIHRGSYRTHLQREIQPHLLRDSEFDLLHLSLKPGKFRADLVGSCLQARKLISPGFITDCCINDSRLRVCRRDRHAWNESTGSVGYRATDRGVGCLREASGYQNTTQQQRRCNCQFPHE